MAVFDRISKQENGGSSGGIFKRISEPEKPKYDTSGVVSAMKTGAAPSMDIRQSQLMQQVEETPIVEKQKPALYRVQKAIYDKTLGPITEKALRVAANVADPFHITRGIAEREGIDLRANPIFQGMSEPETTAEKVTDVVGQIAGTVAPAAVAYKTGGKAAGSLFAKLLPDAPKLAQTAVRGAGAGATFGAAREALEAGTGDEQTIGGRAKDIAIDTVIGGAGDATISAIGRYLGPKVSQTFRDWMNRTTTEPNQPVQELLALPAPKPKALREGPMPSGDVIYAPGTVKNPEPLSLPAGDYVRPQRLKVEQDANKILDQVMMRIKPVVTERMTPPLENQNELAKWVRNHLGEEISLNEVRQLPYEDLRQMAEMMRPRINMVDEATKAARELGYDLPSLLEGKAPSLKNVIQQNSAERVAGVYPDSLPNVKTPKFNREVTGQAAALRQKFKVISDESRPINSSVQKQKFEGSSPQRNIETTENAVHSIKDTQQEELLSKIPVFLRKRKLNSEPMPARETLISKAEIDTDEVVQAVQNPRVRDRVYSYLDEAEKAARERLSAKKNTLSSLPVDQYTDHAIIMAAKLGKGTIKAADFAEELVKEFGEQIRPQAERIFRQTKEVLRQQERRSSKEGQDAKAFNESGQGDAASFDTKISRGQQKKSTPFRQRWEKIRTQFVDDLAPLEGLEKRVRGAVASAEDSLYKAARMFKGTPERANQIVRERLAPVVEAVEKSGFTADDLGRYALAKHAKDVNAAGYKSGFTNAEIESVLQKYGTPEMEEAQQALVKINRDILQELVKNGVVSKDLADTLNERWKNYVPLFRAFDDEKVEFSQGLSGALANVASPIQKLKGSERAVVDPLENMVKNIFQSVNSSERNKVARQLAKLARDDKESLFIRKLDPNEQVGRKNVVNVKENGESIKYEVEPEVYKALLNLDQESGNMLMNILAKPASLLRAGATLTPEFSLRNPMRDVLQAFVTSESGFNPITDFTVGLIQTIKKGDLYKEWVDNLGAYGNVISMDRDVHRQALEKVLKQPPSKKFVNIVNGKGLINLLRAISDTTESATKVGEYRAALRKGATPQEAAYRSRDIMDFARAGSSVRQANRIVAFLNANIQGKSKLIRAIKNNPGGTIARMFTAVTLPTVAIYASNHFLANETQKKTINDAPDWQKDTFWLVAIPGTDTVARIPKPFDIAPLFANLPERALQFTQEKDPEAFDGFVRRTLSDGALPVQITGLWPFIEGMANYSFFREGSIIPQREQGLEFKDQYDPIRTTESAKLLAAGAEKLTGGKGMLKNFSSPRVMDNTIKGLTAGLGTYATSAIDTILDKIGVVDRPIAPQKKLEQRPLAKAFLVDPLASTKSMDKFYEEREKLTNEKNSAKINEREFKDEAKLKVLDASQKLIGDINKAVRTIEANNTMSAKEKREKIDKLNLARNEIARKVMDKLKNVK